MNKGTTRAPLKKRGTLLVPQSSLDAAVDIIDRQQEESNQEKEDKRPTKEEDISKKLEHDTDEEEEEDEQDEGIQHANNQDEANKRKRRLSMNRESARNRRKRKKEQFEELRQRVVTLEEELQAIRRENVELRSENQLLRSSLGPQWNSSSASSSLSGAACGVAPSIHSHQEAAAIQGLVLPARPHPYPVGVQEQLQLSHLTQRPRGVLLGTPLLCQELLPPMPHGNSSTAEQIVSPRGALPLYGLPRAVSLENPQDVLRERISSASLAELQTGTNGSLSSSTVTVTPSNQNNPLVQQEQTRRTHQAFAQLVAPSGPPVSSKDHGSRNLQQTRGRSTSHPLWSTSSMKRSDEEDQRVEEN